MTYDITSSSNERMKWLRRLRDRRQRDDQGLFTVEGERLYGRATGAGLVPSMTFVARPSGVEVGTTVTVDPVVLDRISYRSKSEGLIGVFPKMATNLWDVCTTNDSLLLIADAIEKPGNLGAMTRTAVAAGAVGVIAVGNVDVHNPNALRASTGAIFDLSLAVTEWDDLAGWLASNSIETLGLSPSGDRSLWETDLTGPLAFVVGAEDDGLSAEAVKNTSAQIRIPQIGQVVDSLNASAATAVALFEARRQRTTRSR